MLLKTNSGTPHHTPHRVIEVALAERELSAIGQRRHLQEKLDMAKPSPLTSGNGRKRKTSRGSAAALDASPPPLTLKPSRTSLDNVGEREMKVALLRCLCALV